MSDAKIFGYGSMLIESRSGESDAQLRGYLMELLADVYEQIPDWLVFNIGRCFERRGLALPRFGGQRWGEREAAFSFSSGGNTGGLLKCR